MKGRVLSFELCALSCDNSALDAGCWMLDAGCWMLDAGCNEMVDPLSFLSKGGWAKIRNFKIRIPKSEFKIQNS